MTAREVSIIPWFGGKPIEALALDGTDKVVYTWTTSGDLPDEPKTISHLLVWHDCDRSVWLADSDVEPDGAREASGFVPGGVGLHTLVAADPLHLEASLYWPSCCGMHGFIRDGRWTDA